MSSIAMQGGATGSGTVTLLAPSTSTNRTLTLPDSTGTVATNEAIAAAGYTTSAGVLTQFNASGSAPVYACRAWVNFNGTGTVAIRASGNVSSITDNGAGDYTVNFTTAMQDANYAVHMMIGTFPSPLTRGDEVPYIASLVASSARVEVRAFAVLYDANQVCVSILR